MRKESIFTYVKNIILPGILFSAFTGVLTGAMIFAFKVASGFVIEKSGVLYAYIAKDPLRMLWFVPTIACLGVGVGFLLKYSPHCRGGGIPTAVSILRGLIRFNWIKSVFFVFLSSLITYTAGVPLGNEGPSVQIGTALGKGTVRIFAKKHTAWDRYVMTGGACAGFAVATGAPVSGVFFALEEAHRRFSPMIITVAVTSVISAVFTSDFLTMLTGIELSTLGIPEQSTLELRHFWTVIVVGLLCGLFAALLAKSFHVLHKFMQHTLAKVSTVIKVASVFTTVAVIGAVSYNCVGDGHNLLHSVFENHTVWYMLLLYLAVRVILMIVANNAGVTGGLFVPTLVFGAIIGSLAAKAMIGIGALPEEYYTVLVVVGMTAFLGSSVRTPITAIIFALEVMSGLQNVAFIALGVAVAYITVEVLRVESINDIVIGYKLSEENRGKTMRVVDTYVTVQKGAFAVGKETRDVFWPQSCVVLSVKKSTDPHSRRESGGIHVGDILHVHYLTSDTAQTHKELCAIVGDQDFDDTGIPSDLHPPGHME